MKALELAKPVADSLAKLEQGVPMYDAYLKQQVLVIAPVLLIIADNPMASELCNHQGSTATRYCRLCLVSSGVKQIWLVHCFICLG